MEAFISNNLLSSVIKTISKEQVNWVNLDITLIKKWLKSNSKSQQDETKGKSKTGMWVVSKMRYFDCENYL